MKVYKGDIITVNSRDDRFKYLVEDEGKIVYTGNELPQKYSDADVVDLGNGALLPTFVDTHGHFSSYAMLATTLKLDKCESNSEMIELIKERNRELPAKKTLLCFGASPKVKEEILISKKDIDPVVPNRNVVIICGDGHTAVMNSLADSKMPDVVHKTNGYDAENGWFMHESFMKAVDKILNVVSAADALQAFQEALDVYTESGFGLVCCESGTGFPLDLDIELVKWLYRGQNSGLQVRLFIQSYDIKKAKRRGITRLGGCFKCALDGSITSADAAFSEPYMGTDNNGILFYTDDELYEKIKAIHLAGLSYQMHAIGDRAVMQAARTYKRVLDEYPRENHRHGIIHATLVPDEAMDIIKKYNLQIIGQPIFMMLAAEHPEFMMGRLGEKRAEKAEPYNEFLNRGIMFSCSSDCPVSFPDGFSWINAMVNNPNEAHRVSLTQAIRCCTYNGYYNTFDEDKRGSLETGKIADMIIVDKSPYDIPADELDNIKVVSTILAGKTWKKENKRVLGTLIKGMFVGKEKKL
jgi:predicted amidohydrolase YtcJ